MFVFMQVTLSGDSCHEQRVEHSLASHANLSHHPSLSWSSKKYLQSILRPNKSSIFCPSSIQLINAIRSSACIASGRNPCISPPLSGSIARNGSTPTFVSFMSLLIEVSCLCCESELWVNSILILERWRFLLGSEGVSFWYQR